MWWFLLFYVLVFNIFVLFAPYVCFIFLVKVTDWPPIGEKAAHSAYEMFSWYRYLIVSLIFPTSECFSDCAFSWSLPTCTFLYYVVEILF